MKLHRFYAGELHDKRGPLLLSSEIWVNDLHLVNQWLKVLRFKVGDELSLFDDERRERLYRVAETEDKAVKLQWVTDMDPQVPHRHTYLLWSLLKSDKNDLVLQKTTELGVTNFVPILAERTEKTGFDEARALRIVIEAAEQCGRADIPKVREPISLKEALSEYRDKIRLFVAEQGGEEKIAFEDDQPVGTLVGPEGGWSDAELGLFKSAKLPYLKLGNFTLRAETAAITAAAKLLQ